MTNVERLDAFHVRGLLLLGRRLEAADQAEILVEKADPPVRKLVSVLADELRAMGDRNPKHKRGRPPKRRFDRQAHNLEFATYVCKTAILSHRLVDDAKLSAEELAILAFLIDAPRPDAAAADLGLEDIVTEYERVFRADTTAARNLLLPLAIKFLRTYRLSTISRRGYRSTIYQRVAKRFSVSLDTLKRSIRRSKSD